MSATIIDGRAVAADLRARVAGAAAKQKSEHGIVPGFAVVLVGEDPASSIYVKSKGAAAQQAGFRAFDIRLPAALSEKALLDEIAELNADASVHGILVQMPLPKQIDSQRVIATIDPLKDVDGLHPMNAGRLMSGFFGANRGLVACTPLGALMLIKTVANDVAGADAVVIGRSNLVGKPMAQLLLQENCTVTVAHSCTRDLAGLSARADILVAATGRAEMVKGSWIKPGAIVIDVGINRLSLPDGKTKLVGDVAFDEAMEKARAITPVPGGVGPMTIACLMRNTLMAACLQAGLPAPAV
ncbi:MAG: bifunctional 5,10-methylenetetrahydrofolate dehydrogenase/5,10-methenyltetrahydrofolate cyclohydrolase [Alphaproteobacteria bacterium]